MATINGTSAADTKYGTAYADTISGVGGDDSLYGRAGNDTISGGDGIDRLWGEDGNDILKGDAANDFIYGGNGNDVVYGGIGNDTLHGDAGTDTLKGDAGNDILKGGTGISFLYGGDGTDALYYDPTTANISNTSLVNGYLAESVLDGGTGTDTLNIYNKATYTSGTTTKPAATEIHMGDYERGSIYFENPTTDTGISAGRFDNVEKITVNGGGRLEFYGSWAAPSVDITGTASNDVFHSYSAGDTMRGGAGNDDFWSGGGPDKMVSTATDADRFYFDATEHGTTTITGFNGEGAWGGDRIYIDDGYWDGFYSEGKDEYGGKTTFTFTTGYEDEDGPQTTTATIIVDKVGLAEGVDYFFI